MSESMPWWLAELTNWDMRDLLLGRKSGSLNVSGTISATTIGARQIHDEDLAMCSSFLCLKIATLSISATRDPS